MFAKFSNVNEPSTEARLAAESCTAVHMYTEYSVLFSLAKIIFMPHSVSNCLAEPVAHSGRFLVLNWAGDPVWAARLV